MGKTHTCTNGVYEAECYEPNAFSSDWNDVVACAIQTPRLDGNFDRSRARTWYVESCAYQTTSSENRMRALGPILLFGGIGLLLFLIAILTGMPGEWY
jgi:hypothetical protein